MSDLVCDQRTRADHRPCTGDISDHPRSLEHFQAYQNERQPHRRRLRSRGACRVRATLDLLKAASSAALLLCCTSMACCRRVSRDRGPAVCSLSVSLAFPSSDREPGAAASPPARTVRRRQGLGDGRKKAVTSDKRSRPRQCDSPKTASQPLGGPCSPVRRDPLATSGGAGELKRLHG